ncbi:MAG TPA: crosslink repair DNA glycosylase YcaQ family protein, partial [Anaerolineales bacterium]|nr:crosslink repair DNA glycosylase YcaQ family protein [Anaerolineales bacterium]
GLPGEWWLHADQLNWLAEGAEPRTVLLSPFDNLIADRARTERLFDFEFRIEIYTPVAKRKFGYYVLPILHGERLIGRIDPQFER